MPSIQSMIDTILTDIPFAPFRDTVDVIKAGDPSQQVTGVVTTFLATQEVLCKAVDLGANFIIAHEPIFYNHLDETDWLASDPVYLAKRRFIEEHQLVIWRFHDYWHSHRTDGIITGVTQALGWSAYSDPAAPFLFNLPQTTLGELVAYVKTRLNAHRAQVIGQPDMACRRVALVVGAPGGKFQIEVLRGDVDVMITGEINEWETCEYVRDALAQGLPKGLIVTGHEPSEEAGMAYLVDWLRPRFPEIKITHVPSGDPF